MGLEESVTQRLIKICGEQNVLTREDELLVYECDAYPLARALPQAVVFPADTSMTSDVLGVLFQHDIPFVPRGSGTSLAGGCLACEDSVCVSTARMRKILKLDYDVRRARVQAGVITQDLCDAVQAAGFTYEPDPSSQTTCTIGGNVANNAGGPHSLKYGVTSSHVLGLKIVLPDGEVLAIGDLGGGAVGYDLKSIFVGSEGTLGLITEVSLKLSRLPPACRTVLAVYSTMEDAGQTVSGIIAESILPSALEIMDHEIINIVEDAYALGFPRAAAAVLIIEIDGVEAGLDAQLQRILDICRRHGAHRLEHASSSQDRALLWKARKSAQPGPWAG